MVNEFGEIELSDLNFKHGYSLTPGSLQPYSDEEIKFREEVRKVLLEDLNIPEIGLKLEETEDFNLIRDVITKLGKLGYLGTAFPENLGGKGKGTVYRTIINEEIASMSVSISGTDWESVIS